MEQNGMNTKKDSKMDNARDSQRDTEIEKNENKIEKNGKKDRENREKAMRIFEALSGVDSELLERSEKSGKSAEEEKTGKVIARLTRWNRPLAACFCLVVVGALAWVGIWQVRYKGSVGGNSDTQNYGNMQLTAAKQEEQNGMSPREIEEEEAEDMMAAGAVDLNGGVYLTKTEEAAEALDEEGPEKEGAEQERPEKYVNELRNQKDGKEQNDKREEESVKTEDLGEKRYSGSGAERSLSLEEAREMELLGAYLPDELPAGYEFGEAEAVYDELSGEGAVLYVCFWNGMDDIMFRVNRLSVVSAESGKPIQVVKIEEPASYDVRLYEIPYAETVPEEYREIFEHPIFRAEDLTLALIQARMEVKADAGDTATPRGRFGVLYDDVLVEFSGALSAEQVWELFCEINEKKLHG